MKKMSAEIRTPDPNLGISLSYHKCILQLSQLTVITANRIWMRRKSCTAGTLAVIVRGYPHTEALRLADQGKELC